MPPFERKTAPPLEYQKQERPPATDQSPTLASLLGDRDPKHKSQITIPVNTPYYDSEGHSIKHQDICLNTQTFKPGKTYTLHNLIVEELRRAISDYEEGILLLYQKRNKAGIPQFNIGELEEMEGAVMVTV